MVDENGMVPLREIGGFEDVFFLSTVLVLDRVDVTGEKTVLNGGPFKPEDEEEEIDGPPFPSRGLRRFRALPEVSDCKEQSSSSAIVRRLSALVADDKGIF